MKMPQYVSVTEVTDTVDFANLLTFKDKLILQTKIEDMGQAPHQPTAQPLHYMQIAMSLALILTFLRPKSQKFNFERPNGLKNGTAKQINAFLPKI